MRSRPGSPGRLGRLRNFSSPEGGASPRGKSPPRGSRLRYSPTDLLAASQSAAVQRNAPKPEFSSDPKPPTKLAYQARMADLPSAGAPDSKAKLGGASPKLSPPPPPPPPPPPA